MVQLFNSQIVICVLCVTYGFLLTACTSTAASASVEVQPVNRPTTTATPHPSPFPTTPPPTATPAPTPTPDTRLPLSRTLNILVLGSDRLGNAPNWRTDVMMVVALDLVGQQAAVISIPRDLYLEEIPGHQPNRANVVDYLGEKDEPNGGGPKLLAAILRQRMGVEIHHYIRFDFDAFRRVVDALGGIEIVIGCPGSEKIVIDTVEAAVALRSQPGHYHLNGEAALVYVRNRRYGGDLERARRQQQTVWAVRNAIVQENLLPRIPALYAALADAIQTDIGLVTALQLTRFVLPLEPSAVHGLVLAPPQLLRPGWRQGMAIFVADWPAITAAVQEVFVRPAFSDQGASGCP